MTHPTDSPTSNAIGYLVWAVIGLGYCGAALAIGALAGWICLLGLEY
jgi:hypothetical protein